MSDVLKFLYMIPAVVIAITFHEYAHAKVAIKLGDKTPQLQGRDTINPLVHIDIFGLICLMIAKFGWGRPVQIDIRNFKNPLKDQMLVSLAGPVMNLIVAFISLIILNNLNNDVKEFNYTELTTQINNGNVTELTVTPSWP